MLDFVYDDGGRSKYFKAERVGDCVTRAICNATGKDYKEVYDAISELSKKERTGKRKKGVSSARNGVYKGTYTKYLNSIGWEFVPCMGIGTGCTMHLNENEVPTNEGNIIVSLSKHLSCVKDGKLYDTYDCSREGTRCVYGYFRKKKNILAENSKTCQKSKETTKTYKFTYILDGEKLNKCYKAKNIDDALKKFRKNVSDVRITGIKETR